MCVSNKRAHAKGYTLFELLIALLIFTAGFLALIHLQFSGHRQQQEAFYMSRATQQAFNLTALWSMFATSPGEAIAEQLFNTWQRKQVDWLPQGEGRVMTQGQQQAVIVLWSSIDAQPSYCPYREHDAQQCVALSVYSP